ncbi:class I adenylate-forming enzyme family protein [Streptomyces sp. UMAF16]|nr:class I adenylate-forming enzyme family protein [Streptomyces sp. UMAF16]
MTTTTPTTAPASAAAPTALWTGEHRAAASTLHGLLAYAAAQHADAPYLPAVEDPRQALSFAGTLDFTHHLDAYLTGRGAAVGDRVGLVLPNSTLTALLFLGVIATGRVLVPLNPKSGPAEVEHILDQTAPALIFSDSVLAQQLGLPEHGRHLVDDEAALFRAVMATPTDPHQVAALSAARGDAEVVYLPDVSGRPKGVVLTHANLLSEGFALGERFGFTAEDSFLTVIGLFHNSGQVFSLLTPLWCGARGAVVRPEVAMLRFWQLADRHRPTWTLLVPSFLEMLVGDERRGTRPTLKGVLAGGARLSPELIESFEGTFGINVHQCYGLTETTSVATVEGSDAVGPLRRARGSAGTALPSCEVAVFDHEGQRVAADVPGEVYIRGDNIFDRYYELPEITAGKLIDGWLHTGDLGRIDADGNLFILGRFDDLVIIGGENVYPAEVEKHVPLLDGVAQGFLVAVPHQVMGVELVLVYRPEEGAAPAPERWRAELVRHLSVFKVPRRYVTLAELGLVEVPRTPAGMLDRRSLTSVTAEALGVDGGRS